jgi:hypothetical protein
VPCAGAATAPPPASQGRTKDPVQRAILAHNRDEEKEHAAMLMEWIRRKDGSFEKEMRDYLFTDKPLSHD